MKPEQIENPSLTELKEICKSYIEFLDSKDYSEDNDFDQYIFEAALTALYGKDIWQYVNEKMG